MNPERYWGAVALLRRATTPADRWLAGVLALAIVIHLAAPWSEPGREIQVYRENLLVATLALTGPNRIEVSGKLGPVVVEVQTGSARILEYASPRMIGLRTGWITRRGQVAACVPCGVFIQVAGGATDQGDPNALDVILQ